MTPNNFYLYVFIFLVKLCLVGSSPTKYHRPCQDLSPECLKRSIQAAIPTFVQGYPEYGLETLDPYYIDRLDLAMSGDMIIHFTNGYAKGLKNCIVDFAKLQGNILEAQYHCNLTIKGRYKSKGRLLMFPIDGVGESTIKCHNLRINSVVTFGSRQGSDGQKYLDIKNYKVTHNYDGRISYSMTDLFKGNPEINKAMLDFMNTNWRMIAEEFGTPLVDFGVNCVMRNLKRLLKILPLNQIITVPIDFK